MVTVTGLTAERMLAIEKASIVSGRVDEDELILQTHDGVEIVAGKVRGPEGFAGPTGTSFWVTRTPMWTGETTHVIPISVPGLTTRVGDIIMSTDPSTVGIFGRVINVVNQNNVTVSYLGSLGGGENAIAEPGTMVWRGDYDPWAYYHRGDMVKTPDGIFVGLSESQGESPSLPVDPFVDAFDREEMGAEWQINDGWEIVDNRARVEVGRNTTIDLVKTDLSPDGQLRLDGVARQYATTAFHIYLGWVDDQNHYRVRTTGNYVYLQQIINGVTHTIESFNVSTTSTLGTIIVEKSGTRFSYQRGNSYLVVDATESLTGSGWGFGFNPSATSSRWARVDSVEFTPAQSDSWGVVSSPTSLGGLSDVLGSTPSHGDFLSYDSAASRWVPTPIDLDALTPGEGEPETNPPEGGGVQRLDELQDIDVSELSDGQSLTYNAVTETWVPRNPLLPHLTAGSVQFVGQGSAQTTGGKTLNVSFEDVNVRTGDLLVLAGAYRESPLEIPDGWTLLGDQQTNTSSTYQTTFIYVKTAEENESKTVELRQSSSDRLFGNISVWRNVESHLLSSPIVQENSPFTPQLDSPSFYSGVVGLTIHSQITYSTRNNTPLVVENGFRLDDGVPYGDQDRFSIASTSPMDVLEEDAVIFPTVVSPHSPANGVAYGLLLIPKQTFAPPKEGDTLVWSNERWTYAKPEGSDPYTGPPIIVSETAPENPEIGTIWVDLSTQGE